jgi:hypothetical protein
MPLLRCVCHAGFSFWAGAVASRPDASRPGSHSPVSGGAVEPSILEDVAYASRILAAQGILDAFGLMSMRHPQASDRFLMSHSLAPALVTAQDISWSSISMASPATLRGGGPSWSASSMVRSTGRRLMSWRMGLSEARTLCCEDTIRHIVQPDKGYRSCDGNSLYADVGRNVQMTVLSGFRLAKRMLRRGIGFCLRRCDIEHLTGFSRWKMALTASVSSVRPSCARPER